MCGQNIVTLFIAVLDDLLLYYETVSGNKNCETIGHFTLYILYNNIKPC